MNTQQDLDKIKLLVEDLYNDLNNSNATLIEVYVLIGYKNLEEHKLPKALVKDLEKIIEETKSNIHNLSNTIVDNNELLDIQKLSDNVKLQLIRNKKSIDMIVAELNNYINN